MLDEFGIQLNNLLVSTFRNILKVEELSLRSIGNGDMTMSEMHLIESVAKSPSGATVSEIASDLQITLPSVTSTVNRLEKRGYLERRRSEVDGRVVHIYLTDRGRKVNRIHEYYHEQMIRNLSKTMTEEEKRVLTSGIVKINTFFSTIVEEPSKNDL